jgi:hypothetical protein
LLTRLLIFVFVVAASALAQTPGIDLYRSLATVGLDPQRVLHIRDADLDLEDLHLSFEEGTIAFTQPVNGKVTGAFFVGEGTILVIPPNQVERASLDRFTKSSVLNERLHTAYLRFNDEGSAHALEAAARGPEKDGGEFVSKWNPLAKNLASADALRLTVTLLNSSQSNSRFLHAGIAGDRLGAFEAFYDRSSPEAVIIAQAGRKTPAMAGRFQDSVFEDVWLSFPSKSQRAAAAPVANSTPRQGEEQLTQTDQLQPDENGLVSFLHIDSFDITADLAPPTELRATATLHIRPRQSGVRAAIFQLSRNLKVSSVKLDGAPIEFLQNPALPGTHTERAGNDLVAIVLSEALSIGDHRLEFQYAGPVMTDTGGGLLYVGDRGTWYPNFGLRNANFDLRFRVPDGWKLVATGDPVTEADAGTLHFRTSRPVPVAGFNVGRYTQAQSAPTSHSAIIHALATAHTGDLETAPAVPLEKIAETSAQVVNFLEQHLGAFPYRTLAISEVPGGVSQGWPGLVYLSTEAFTAPRLGAEPQTEFARILFQDVMLPHEIGHQYWGDNVSWRSYREQWLSEALANYCALMFLSESKASDPAIVLAHYRDRLLRPEVPNAPVTLGLRLDSSLSPQGYSLLTYGRGTWLIHMLRSMLRDAAILDQKTGDSDEGFWQALASLQAQHAGGAMGLTDLQSAFENVLPRRLRYENTASLGWLFDSWINGSSIPRLELRSIKLTAAGSGSGIIGMGDTPRDFTALVPIYAELADGKRVLVAQVFCEDTETAFRVKVPPHTTNLLLDPEHELLRRD